MLIRHAIDLKVTMPAEFMQNIGPILAHEASEFFVADLEHWRFENYADRLTRSAAGVAIIPVSMPGRTGNEQTYVPSLGRGYSFSGVNASNSLWSNIKSESFDEASDVDHLLYQEGFSSTIDFPNKPFVLVGEPINPAKILGGFIDAINSADTIPNRGGFLFAHPSEGCFNHAKLVSRAWVKLPSITLPVDPDDYGLIWGERNEFLGRHEWTNSSWNSDWDDRNVCRHVKHHRQSYVGKLMSLYSDYSRKKEIVIRRMHLSDVLNHNEFIQPDDDYDPELSILCELNRGRFSKSNSALRYVRMHRTGQNSDFYLKVAHITTIAQSRNPNLTGNKPRIQRNRLQALIDTEICGFSPNIERETINWIFSIDLDSDELGEELVNQWLEIEDRMENVCKIRPLDCSGMSPKSLESNLEGLANGFRALTELISEEEDVSYLIEPIAKLLYYIDGNLDDGQTLLDKYQNAISVDSKDVFLDAVIERLERHDQEEQASDLLHLRDQLQAFSGITYDELLHQWDHELSPEEQWERFISANVLPNPKPTWKFMRQNTQFRRHRRLQSVRDSFLFVSQRDATRFFDIRNEEDWYDANRWGIDGDHILFIVDDQMTGMLPAARYNIPENVDLPNLSAELSLDENPIELVPRWAFVQILLALHTAKENQIQIDSAEDLLCLLPKIREVEDTKLCTILGQAGEMVQVGKTGWNIEASGDDTEWYLQTNLASSSHKDTLSLLLRRIGINILRLRQASLRDDDGRALLANFFDMPDAVLTDAYEQLKQHETMSGNPILNPWGGGDGENEASLWGERFGLKPDWRSDMNLTLVRTEASDVLRRYTTALKVLLERGELKASDTRPESDQQKLTNFNNIRDQLKNNLYPNTASMVSDEPILYPTGEGVPTMGNARRYHDDRELELIESADLQQFLGNQLFLSRFMSHRATMTADAYGLRERPEERIKDSVLRLLSSNESWGGEDQHTILLANVMTVGERNPVSLRVHKFHAICMCALDQALEEILSE